MVKEKEKNEVKIANSPKEEDTKKVSSNEKEKKKTKTVSTEKGKNKSNTVPTEKEKNKSKSVLAEKSKNETKTNTNTAKKETNKQKVSTSENENNNSKKTKEKNTAEVSTAVKEKTEEKIEIEIDTDENTKKTLETENITENAAKSFKQVEPENKKTSKHSILAIGIFLVIFLCLIFIIFGVFTFYNYKVSSAISKGLYINNIDISELTKEEAKDRLEKYYADKLSNDITLIHNDYTTYIKTSEIGLSYDIDAAIDYAYNVGKTKNIFADNYQVFNALVNGINITPNYTFDEEALRKILNNLSAELPDTVVESGYYIEGNNLIITQGKDGYVIDADSTISEIKQLFSDLAYVSNVIEIKTIAKSPEKIDIDKIYEEIYTEPKDAYYTTDPHAVYPSSNGVDFGVSIEEAKNMLKTADNECTIPLKVLYPNVTTNMLGQEAFPDLLATFSTKYAASNTNRTTNLRLAANKIDGYVLLPDEIFSYNAVVGERTIAAGYKEAAVYQNGEVVQGLGGGICQISTTLYNAALFSNLEIVELYNHQFVPSYVTAGRDATVVYGVKDFKFKNSRKHAIKLTCSVSGGVATFNIWGYKEDVEYDVSVYATVTSRTSSYIKSSTYRTIKLNGETIKNENIINSTYKAH